MGEDLTPKERYKIYLEEKARSEARDILAAKKRKRAAAEKKKKERTQRGLGCLGLVILIVIGAKFCPSELEDPTKKGGGGEERSKTQDQRKVPPPRRSGSFESKTTGPSEKEPEFAFTVEEFISRFNRSLQNLEIEIQVTKELENETETDDGKALAIFLSSNKNIRVLIWANNITRMVRTITLLAMGDGTMRSAFDMLFAPLGFVMAIENPSTPASQRNGILRDLGFTPPDGMTKNTTVVRHGVKYERTWSASVGMQVIAKKVQSHVSGLRPSRPSPHFSPRSADQLRQQTKAQKNRQRQLAPAVPQDLVEAATSPWPQIPHAATKVDQRPQLAKESSVSTTVPEPTEVRRLSAGVTPPTVLSRIEPAPRQPRLQLGKALGPTPTHAQVDCANWNTASFFEAAKLSDVTRCLQLGADLETRDGRGETPLYQAVINGTAEVVTALLGAGANPDARNVICMTPLHFAATLWRSGAGMALLAAGADPALRNEGGDFPFDEIPGGIGDVLRLQAKGLMRPGGQIGGRLQTDFYSKLYQGKFSQVHRRLSPNPIPPACSESGDLRSIPSAPRRNRPRVR